MRVVVGSAQRPVASETMCGDQHVIAPRGEGVLLCLADGLGHGPAAYAASAAACEHARAHADEPLEALIRGMNAALVGTRGAAISLVVVEPELRRVCFVGVGNVELRTVSRANIAPPTTPGIVGQGLRKVRVWEYGLAEGDLLVLMSDGISTRFGLETFAHLQPQALAEALLATHHKSHDDACCVVARVVAGGGSA